MAKYRHVCNLLTKRPWAILPEKLNEITELIRLKASGVEVKPWAAVDKPEPKLGGGVAVLPLFGLISQRANLLTDFSGGTSTQKFTSQFRAALRDPEVGSIVIDVDSPGGGVFGVEELATEIFQAREQKRIVAVANSWAASAAYWIASAAGELVVTPGGQVGSIGVYAVHDDFSKALDNAGIKVTYISAGKFKTEDNPDEPLSEEARAHIQEDINRIYDMFTAAVARNRGVKTSEVKSGFGEGRMVGARDAVKLGMADRIATLDQTVARLIGRRRESGSQRVQDESQDMMRTAEGTGARNKPYIRDEEGAGPMCKEHEIEDCEDCQKERIDGAAASRQDGLSDEDRRRRLGLQERI